NLGDFQSGELLLTSPASCLDVSMQGNLMCVGFTNGFIALYNLPALTENLSTATLESEVRILRFSCSSELVAGGFAENKIVVWTLKDLEVLFIIDEHQQPITGLCFMNENQYLITGSVDNTILIHDLQKKRDPVMFKLYDLPVTCFKYLHQFDTLYFA